MEQKKVSYFTTGEFAKLCKVNKQTLVYYEKIGLLSPIKKDANGYRYYTVRQHEVFDVISLLKDLGMSLKEIRTFMNNRSPELFLQLMYEQKEKVTQKKKAMERAEKIITEHIYLIEEAQQTDFSKISLVQHGPKTLYLSRSTDHATEEGFFSIISDFIEDLERYDLDSGKPIGGVKMIEDVIAGAIDNYRNLYVEQSSPRNGFSYFYVEAGIFLVGYHIGEEATLHETYARLFAEAKAQNLTLGTYILEEYVYDTVVKHKAEEYVTKIMMSVQGND